MIKCHKCIKNSIIFLQDFNRETQFENASRWISRVFRGARIHPHLTFHQIQTHLPHSVGQYAESLLENEVRVFHAKGGSGGGGGGTPGRLKRGGGHSIETPLISTFRCR